MKDFVACTALCVAFLVVASLADACARRSSYQACLRERTPADCQDVK